MKLILDTHILIAIALERLDEVDAGIARGIGGPGVRLSASVASLWEIAIKVRLGKLDPGLPVERLAAFYGSVGITVLPITVEHAVASVDPWPPTRDPFDRRLLAQCHVESARLVTLDGALRDHPLAARFDG